MPSVVPVHGRISGAWVPAAILMLSLACEAPGPRGAVSEGPVGRATAAVGSGVTHTFPAGSLIIPMDTSYQDRGMLRAFGLVYQLLLNRVPVSWVIRRGKARGEVDFIASATDRQTGAPITSHGYRGGPFVIDLADVAAATPIVAAWQTTYPDTRVHVASVAFDGHVRVQLVSAPNIAMFADGNQDIARGYVQAAGIPDSTGSLAWANTSPDMLDPTEVEGPTRTRHDDGALFDADGDPVYCQMMSMHWNVADANTAQGREVVAEYREYLRFPVHLFAECQAVNAIENNVNGHFLTPNGFNIGARPATYEFFNADLPFAQMDGPFDSVGGSEPSYSLPLGDSYLDGDVVMITGAGDGTGRRDVWMTGYVGGGCSILSESCDPSVSQGKVSYLGGHRYTTAVPISTNPQTQGTRLFLNSLFEAPCATDVGQPTITVFKSGPSATDTGTVTWTLVYANAGPGVALAAALEDTLPPGASFVAATGGGTWDGTRVRWTLGNLGNGESGSVTVTASLSSFGDYENSAVLRFRSGLTPFSATSNAHTTCYHPPGDASVCTGSGSPSSRACSNGVDDDGDGLVDFGADPGCHALNDDDERDTGATPADVQARLLIVFDTSGSMNWNTCAADFTGGDGSLECPGSDVQCSDCGASGCENGAADDSRIDRAKRGISDAVTAFGEVEYALMRFRQLPVTFSCPNRNANRQSGGWLGAGASPCSSFAAGDVLVSFDHDNVYDLLEWTDGSSNHPSANPPVGEDWELRGSGNTPLAGSLASALSYLGGVEGADPAAGCRPYVVILITDGQETCAGDPVSAATALRAAGFPVYVIGFAVGDPAAVADLNGIASAGGTTSAIFVDDSTALSAALATIVGSTVLVESCNGLDDDCDGLVDEGFALYCDRPGGVSSATLCADPGEQVCDGVDDNCDGRVDEGLLNACGLCGLLPVEVCDLIDNDCDGIIDEEVCDCGVPEPEICDGLDNDCDGGIDEGVTRVCGRDVGVCTTGVELCVAGVFGACSGVVPSPETCDGRDEDCDGVVDGITRPCGSSAGECRPGAETCATGVWGGCVGGIGPRSEICNDRDDDCDGLVDEDDPGGGATCGSSIGECTPGTLRCTGGLLVCIGGTTPSPETCNGLDDDCDGRIDEELPTLGACGACGAGVRTCVGGSYSCTGDRSPSAEICNGIDDDCDGSVDEGNPGAGARCGDDTGECVSGTLRCTGGRLVCEGSVGPQAEVCNGLDDDCDGVIDDGLDVGAPCGTGLGECVPGLRGCVAGEIVCQCPAGYELTTRADGVDVCAPARDPALTEVCNALDDDCDGSVDEELPLGAECGSALGVCTPGRLACVAGGEVCLDATLPRIEACDCLDDDCDGAVDEDPETGSLCPAGSICIDCSCALRCADSEFGRCPAGRVPLEREDGCFCVTPRCDAIACAEETVEVDGVVRCAPGSSDLPVCVCRSNACTFACDGVSCTAPAVCDPRDGRCVADDCRGLGCPSGRICDLLTFACVDDLCEGVACDAEEACRRGACEASCATLECPPGEVCRHGTCSAERCAGTVCGASEVCDPRDGSCREDRCEGVVCQPGTTCDPLSGGCPQDECAFVRCPSRQRCLGGECRLESAPDGGVDGGRFDAGEDRVWAGGGCVCRATSSAPGSREGLAWWIGALALACLWRADQRRRLARRSCR